MGAGTGAAGVGTAGNTEPALVGCEGIAGAAAASVPPKAGGGGTALARVCTAPIDAVAAIGELPDGAVTAGGTAGAGTPADSVPAPGGAATAALCAPPDTELKP